MLFSFIIPTYNGEVFLLECIDSIKDVSNYTKQLVEIIIVDDGSYDNSSRICDDLLLASNITTVHQNNSGVSNARNHGIDIANGDYIIFIDADDYVDSIKLANCIDLITNDKEIDMLIYGISFDYYHNNRIYRNDEFVPALIGKKTINDCLKNINCLFDSNAISSLWSKIIAKRAINNMRLKEDMILYEDLEFSLRLLKNCNYIYLSNQSIYHYRQNESHINRIRKIENIDVITNRISNDLNMMGCEDRYIANKLDNYLISQKQKSMSYSELKENYPKKANSIYIKRTYRKFRHFVGEKLKQTFGDFNK